MVKNFLAGWILWQLFVISIAGAIHDINRNDYERKVDCSNLSYFIRVTVIDVSLPLLQFTDFKTRDCIVGTER